MNRKTEIIKHLSNKEKVYELKIGNVVVQMDYSKNGKRIDECMLNILKQKNKRN